MNRKSLVILWVSSACTLENTGTVRIDTTLAHNLAARSSAMTSAPLLVGPQLVVAQEMQPAFAEPLVMEDAASGARVDIVILCDDGQRAAVVASFDGTAEPAPLQTTVPPCGDATVMTRIVRTIGTEQVISAAGTSRVSLAAGAQDVALATYKLGEIDVLSSEGAAPTCALQGEQALTVGPTGVRFIARARRASISCQWPTGEAQTTSVDVAFGARTTVIVSADRPAVSIPSITKIEEQMPTIPNNETIPEVIEEVAGVLELLVHDVGALLPRTTSRVYTLAFSEPVELTQDTLTLAGATLQLAAVAGTSSRVWTVRADGLQKGQTYALQISHALRAIGGNALGQDVTLPFLVDDRLFVGALGLDTNSGLDALHPKRTVSGAIAAAQEADRIVVQAGDYVEDVTVATAVQILGGFASDFTSATAIGVQGAARTAIVGRMQVTQAATLDNLSLSNESTSPTLSLSANATVQNTFISGGVGANTQAVLISAASPRLVNTVIHAGCASVEETAVNVTGGSPMIVNNTLYVGCSGLRGGAVRLGNSAARITNNVIVVARLGHAGIWQTVGSPASLERNAFSVVLGAGALADLVLGLPVLGTLLGGSDNTLTPLLSFISLGGSDGLSRTLNDNDWSLVAPLTFAKDALSSTCGAQNNEPCGGLPTTIRGEARGTTVGAY